jgi:D-xylulose reductase
MRFAAAPGPPDTPGTLTKFYRVAEDFVYKISASMGLAEAVMVEPLAVAVHAVKLGDVRPGETVVVMGSGTVGLLCAAVARQFGAHRVISVDILPKKLEFAREYLGCETYQFSTAGSAEDNAAALLKQFDLEEDGTDTFGGRVDTVIAASGAGSSIETGIHILFRQVLGKRRWSSQFWRWGRRNCWCEAVSGTELGTTNWLLGY